MNIYTYLIMIFTILSCKSNIFTKYEEFNKTDLEIAKEDLKENRPKKALKILERIYKKKPTNEIRELLSNAILKTYNLDISQFLSRDFFEGKIEDEYSKKGKSFDMKEVLEKTLEKLPIIDKIHFEATKRSKKIIDEIDLSYKSSTLDSQKAEVYMIYSYALIKYYCFDANGNFDSKKAKENLKNSELAKEYLDLMTKSKEYFESSKGISSNIKQEMIKDKLDSISRQPGSNNQEKLNNYLFKKYK